MTNTTTEDERDVWSVHDTKEPSCSAENNDNIEFVHNAEERDE